MSTKIPLPSIAKLPADAPTRVRILTAGVEVLHTDGFAALTQQAVAERAGVRQSHITYYFPTRIDLLQAVAQFGAEAMMQPIASAAIGDGLTFEAFRELLLPDFPDRSWWRLMTALVSACAESENIRSWILQFDADVRLRLREGFSAFGMQLSDLQVEVLHASYIGALTLDMQSLTDASQARAREVVRTAFDLVTAQINGSAPMNPKAPQVSSAAPPPPPPPPRPPIDEAKTSRRKPSIAKRKK